MRLVSSAHSQLRTVEPSCTIASNGGGHSHAKKGLGRVARGSYLLLYILHRCCCPHWDRVWCSDTSCGKNCQSTYSSCWCMTALLPLFSCLSARDFSPVTLCWTRKMTRISRKQARAKLHYVLLCLCAQHVAESYCGATWNMHTPSHSEANKQTSKKIGSAVPKRALTLTPVQCWTERDACSLSL